jgi:hypothetical protein
LDCIDHELAHLGLLAVNRSAITGNRQNTGFFKHFDHCKKVGDFDGDSLRIGLWLARLNLDKAEPQRLGYALPYRPAFFGQCLDKIKNDKILYWRRADRPKLLILNA